MGIPEGEEKEKWTQKKTPQKKQNLEKEGQRTSKIYLETLIYIFKKLNKSKVG